MNLQKELAPIFVSVYNRYEHFVRCIESLKNSEGSKKTSLYITSDGPRNANDKKTIDKIRDYINSIEGFKKVIPYLPTENTEAKIIQKAYKDIKNSYSSMIRSEDDNIFTPDFLLFMNDALYKYENEDRVYSVSAFSHSIFFDLCEEKKNKVYFTKRYNPWGSATWFRKRDIIKNIDHEALTNFLKHKHNIKALDKIGIDLYPELAKMCRSNMKITGDYRSILAMLINDMYTVSPYSTKAFNIGNDGSGTRTLKSKRFVNVNLDESFTACDYQLTDFSEEQINNSFNYRYFNTNRARAKRILTNIGLYDMIYPLKKILR